VCPKCGRLTHLEELQAIVMQARQLASAGQLQAAKEHWQMALRLVPQNASEYQGIVREVQRLEARMNPQAGSKWTKRLGPFGAVIAVLVKFKSALLLLKGGFLFNILGFLVFYWALYGWWFGLGLFLSIMVHELGHYVTARRMGFQANLPRFHFFGAYVRWGGAGCECSGGGGAGRSVVRLAVGTGCVWRIFANRAGRVAGRSAICSMVESTEFDSCVDFRRGSGDIGDRETGAGRDCGGFHCLGSSAA
jgi:hypothetical protein